MNNPEQLPEEAEDANVAPTSAAEAETTIQSEDAQPKPQLSIDITDEYLSSKVKFE